MWDDERDKQMMRNQMVAILLMTVLLMAWFFLFMPQQPVRRAPAPQQPLEQAAEQPKAPEPTREPVEREPAAGEEEWPFLPPVPQEDDYADDEVILRDEDLELVFTRIGGRLKQATVLIGDDGEDTNELIPALDGVLDTEAVYPLGLRFTHAAIGDALDRRRFEAEVHRSGRSVTFTLELPGAAVIRKTFTLTETRYVLDVQVEYQNIEADPRVLGMDTTPAFILNWGPKVTTGDEGRYSQPYFIWRQGVENETLSPEDLPVANGVPETKWVRDVEWFGYKGKYFIAAFKPEFDGADAWVRGTENDYRFGLAVSRFEVNPGESQRRDFRLYMGPMHLGALGDAWNTLPTALTFFTMFEFMDWFAKFLLGILNWCHDHTIANYGIAIIILTVLVRVVMFPLTLKSMRNMKKMQLLAPEMEEIRKKYKDDQQEISKKMMEMYKDRGVNPLGGCFPMLLQMPVFIALYRMLWNAFELRGATFLWIEDLSKPDHLFHMPFMKGLPLVGDVLEYFNLLPILMGAAMVLSVKIMPTSGPAQNPQQKMMMTMMPIFFSVVCYNLAAGLNLYVLTSTVLGMVQQHFVRAGSTQDMAEEVKKRATARKKKKQHFYTRAKEHRRQLAKEAKRKSKAR